MFSNLQQFITFWYGTNKSTSIFQLLDFDPIAALRDSDGNGKSMGGIVNTTGQDTFKV